MRADQVLLDVVRRAFAQRGLVERAAAVPRHEDERLVGAEVLRGPDQIETRAVGEPLIDEINVVFVGLDALEACRRGGDDLDLPLEVRVEQRHLDERLRLRVVVDQQDGDMTQVMRRTRRPSHAGGGFRFLQLFQNETIHKGYPGRTRARNSGGKKYRNTRLRATELNSRSVFGKLA